MLQKGAREKLKHNRTQGGFYSNIFLVPKKDGKMRPVINLKALNQFVVTRHFKMEGIHTLRDLLQPNDWLTKIDLKDAYFAIPIHQQDQNLLRFSVAGQHYQFTCLPFGLSSAPWAFTKILKPATTLLREQGVRLIQYIDDILIMADSRQKATEHTLALKYLLTNLGFTIHPDKSITLPTQRLEFLGMVVDTTLMQLQAPGEKIRKIRQEARSLLRQHTSMITARKVSRIVGKMSAMSQAIPPAPLFYRSLQGSLSKALDSSQGDYEAICRLTEEAKEELQWWATHLEHWNGKSLLVHEPQLVIESDASLRGWGASLQGTQVQTGGPWSLRERQHHINCLEILAASLAIKTFARNQTDTSILILIDNTTAVSYINHLGGTVSPRATTLTKELWMWCLVRPNICQGWKTS